MVFFHFELDIKILRRLNMSDPHFDWRGWKEGGRGREGWGGEGKRKGEAKGRVPDVCLEGIHVHLMYV